MPDADPSIFAPSVVTAVTTHMNAKHAEDNVLIVNSLGGLHNATEAEMTGYDEHGALFTGTVEGSPTTTMVPWQKPLTERASIHVELVAMYHGACDALGIEPRPATEH